MCNGSYSNSVISYIEKTGVLGEEKCNYECAFGQKTTVQGSNYYNALGCDGVDDCNTGM
tara:strand:- start:655 stop:831 length:177 start_codon:yes stop_codon:yes gene_type:complete